MGTPGTRPSRSAGIDPRRRTTGITSRGIYEGTAPNTYVLFGELLDASPTNLELLSNHRSVHAVVNNSLTDPGGVILSKFHLTWLIVRQIAPTKSLADTTPRQSKRSNTLSQHLCFGKLLGHRRAELRHATLNTLAAIHLYKCC